MMINFFLNSLSIHQAPLIRKLAECNLVTVYYDNDISEKRMALGWSIPNFGQATLTKLDVNTIDIDKLKEKKTINIYSGIDSYKNINHCLRSIAPNSCSKNIVQMESIHCSGVKGFLRKIKYIILAKKYNKIVDAYLCQGSGKQFSKLGFKNTHEFGYFLDKSTDANVTENKKCKFIYLGALSKRKQILDVAMAINDTQIELDIYGSEEDIPIGMLESAIRNSKGIKYKGMIGNEFVSDVVKNYDYLILPSKTEGWGAVISEALLSGVGVVVTNSAGIVNYIESKIEHKVHIYNFEKMDKLPQFLLKLSVLTISDRNKIIEQASCLSVESGADLLLGVVRK